jgi:ABC-2 type transport system ATP-binding protein
MPEPSPAIFTKNLSKKYSGVNSYALRDLNIKIMPGEVYGFLGPNGAGKSTTIRILMNFIQPSSGNAQICGQDIVKDSVVIKSRVGYLSGEVELYPKMSGKEFLDYMSDLQPPKNKNYKKELAKIFEANLSRPIHDLSKGNRQKIGLIQAFMHEPEVLILDEPTSGLDPLMQEQFFELVSKTKTRGATLFISSHNLGEVQKMCDRVGFIREGKLIGEQNIAAAISDAARTFDVTFAEKAPVSMLEKIKDAKISRSTDKHATIHMRGDLSPMFKELSKHNVTSINQRELNLEEEFLHFYKGKSK